MTTTESSPPVCPRCGTSLQNDAPEGLCPRCLAAVNFETGSLLTAAGTSLPPPPVEEIAPHFPQLEILSCLGRGGMGVVYKARQISLDRLVALKLLAPEREKDPEFSDRFAREAQALARMSHPHIVTVHDFGQAGGFFYLLMEYVDGANLRQLLQSHKFTPEQALAVVPPLCDALQYAHDRGIVHRDIKPENLLMDRDGKLKVADFGLVKMLGTTASGDERPVGTPSYMAPEQAGDPANVDNRADIYSLGVVIYEMLTGELPGKNFQPPSSKAAIDPRLDEVVQRAMEQDPDQRYQQASILKTEVERISEIPPAEPGSPAAAVAGNANATNVSDEVRLPAIAMMVASGLAITGQILGVLVMLLMMVLPRKFMRDFPMHFDMPFFGTAFGGMTNLVFVAIGGWMLIMLGLNIAVLIGANRMRKQECYPWSMAAAVILIVCGVLSLPVLSLSLGGLVVLAQLGAGIWALVVLLRDGVKAGFGNPPAAENPPPSTPPLAGDLKRKLTIPAVGLMVASGINLILLGLFLVFAILKTTASGQGMMLVWPVIILPFIAIPSLVTFFGAWRMREMKGYVLSIVAAILALVTPPGLLIGVVFGIWALVVLSDKEVKAGFQLVELNPSGKGVFIAAAVMAAILLLLVVPVLLVSLHIPSEPSIPPVPTTASGSAADLASRFEASQTIRDFTVRDSDLASIAKDAAASGNAAMAKQALQTIVDFTVRDDARKAVAFLLSDRGMRKEAVIVAKQIMDFTKRDEVLAELSTRKAGLTPEAEPQR